MIAQLLGTEQRTAIERWCRDRARAVSLPHGKTLCRVLGEYPMVVNLEDLEVAPHLALDGFWEMWLSICLAKRLRPGWKCIDVGANVGYFSVLIAKITGAEVHAWEPAPDVATMLRDTLAMNGLKGQVTVIEAAAGAETRLVCLERDEKNWGSTHVYKPRNVPSHTIARDVPVWRLDSFSGDKLGSVDFIKIDAEGYEPEIWRGMSSLLERGQPQAILMEWSPKKYDDARGFLSTIERHYSVHIVDGQGELQKPAGDITAVDGHLDLWLERHASD